jgi:hypothetical protein
LIIKISKLFTEETIVCKNIKWNIKIIGAQNGCR